MFYSGVKDELKQSISDSYAHAFGPSDISDILNDVPQSDKIVGIICPHAGYMYSGPIACNSFKAISNEEYDLFIIFGPNHWGLGYNVATMKDCVWETPLGKVEVDSGAADMLDGMSDVVDIDYFSHSREHSIEVQIPIIQYTFSNNFKILPIALIDQTKETAIKMGKAISEITKGRKAMIIGSSDFTHYESNEYAHKQDMALIKPILDMDVDEFYRVLKDRNISACGYGAIASTMIASRELGATRGTLLKYATSGDVMGDNNADSVVGYGSIVFT
jgi:AmmeMemoRadiSam system protein B